MFSDLEFVILFPKIVSSIVRIIVTSFLGRISSSRIENREREKRESFCLDMIDEFFDINFKYDRSLKIKLIVDLCELIKRRN